LHWVMRVCEGDNTEQYANNRVECDHGRLKARLRPMRGLKRDHSARVVMRGHALTQNLRRGFYELGTDARAHRRVAPARHGPTQRNRALVNSRAS
jgi:transposase-like protein